MSVAASRPLRFASLIVTAVVAAGACSAGPALSDPKEILTKAVEALQAAKTVHLAVTVDGQFVVDILGTGGGSMALTGTSLQGDLDFERARAKLTFAVPALLGLSGELISVDGASYVKTNITGELYQKTAAGDALPIDPTDPNATFDALNKWLEKPEVAPRKLDDVDCGGRKCYQVSVELTGAELAGLSSPDPASMDPNALIVLTFKVDKDPVRLHELTASISMGAQGALTIVLTLSDWDKGVTIEAPPADQIGEGSGLPF